MTFQFFAGKGGAGKTTCAAAAAVRRAEAGARVLVVSTDPAHSLGDALEGSLSAEPARVPTCDGELLAAELDAGKALSRWLGVHRDALELLLDRGTWLDREDVRRLLDLSPPGIDELIGLIELLRLAAASGCQEVVVDTAPTAHTLRLLAMPGELHRFAATLDRLQDRHRLLAERFGGSWQPDRADALIVEIAEQAGEIEALLRDPQRTLFRWVLLPEALSVAETVDSVRALEESGLLVAELVVNRLTPAPDRPCAPCEARRRAEAEATEELRARLPGRTLRFVASRRREPRGLAALRGIGREMAAAPGARRRKPSPPGPLSRASPAPPPRTGEGESRRSVPAWLRETLPGDQRLLFFGGKGGVGKTTCAAAAALVLAAQRRNRRVLLLSTDPAHSLADVLAAPLGDDERPIPGGPPNLRARELDPARTFEDWRRRWSPALDEAMAGGESEPEAEALRKILDLAPPGIAEMSAVSVLIDAGCGGGSASAYDLVVVDTAPTGHALQLLAMPALMLEWVRTLLSLLLKYREAMALGRLAEGLVELSKGLHRLQETLRDPGQTAFLAVTRAAELPRRETVRLLAELDRLGLAVPAVLVDAVTSDAGCTACRRAGESEERQIRRLAKDLARRCGIILAPAVFPPPRGADVLAAWACTWKTRSV